MRSAYKYRGVTLILFTALYFALPDALLADYWLVVWAWLKPAMIVAFWIGVSAVASSLLLSYYTERAERND